MKYSKERLIIETREAFVKYMIAHIVSIGIMTWTLTLFSFVFFSQNAAKETKYYSFLLLAAAITMLFQRENLKNRYVGNLPSSLVTSGKPQCESFKDGNS